VPFEEDDDTISSSGHAHTHRDALDSSISLSHASSSSSSHKIVEGPQSLHAFGGLVPQALLAHILDETLPAQGRIDALKILEAALQEQAEHSPLVLRAHLKPMLHFMLVLLRLPSSPLTHLAAFSTLRVLVDLGGPPLDLYIDDILAPLLFELLPLHYQDAEGTAAVLSILGRLCQHVGLKHLLPHLSRPRQGIQDGGDNEINAWTHPHPSVRAAALRLLLAGLLAGSKAPTSIGGIDPHALLKLAFSLWREDEPPEIVRLAKAAVCLIYQCYYEDEDQEDEEEETMEDEFYVLVLAEDVDEKEVLGCLQEFVPPILTAEELVVLHDEGEEAEGELKFPIPPTPAPEESPSPSLPPPPLSPSVDRSKLAMLKHKITMQRSPPSSPQRLSLPTPPPPPPPPSPPRSLPRSPPSPSSSSSPRRRMREKVFVKWNDDEENEQDTDPLTTTATTTTTTTFTTALLPSPLPSPARRRRIPPSPSTFSPSSSSSFAATSSPTTTEYLAIADIHPLPDAPHDLPLVLSSLQNDDWPEIFQTLTNVRRLALHHATLLHDLSVLQLLLRQVLRHIENLRSAVAKNALLALADVWFGLLGGRADRHEEAATVTRTKDNKKQTIHTYQQLMESELGSMTPILVKRSCDTSGFLVEAAEAALNAIIIYTPDSSRVLQSFLPMSAHRNPAMRSKVASLVLRCLLVMVEEKLSGDGSAAPLSPSKAKRSSSKNNLSSSSSSCFIHNKDLLARVVHTAQQWLKDANAETRAQARLIWEVLASENVIKAGGA
jgi:hypothetical protein